MAKRGALSPQRLAAQMALDQIDAREIFNDMVEDERFTALLAALLDEEPAHCRRHALTLSEEVALYEQLQAGLSEDLKARLFAFNEWKDLDQGLRQEAGFLLGVEIGRRLGGAR